MWIFLQPFSIVITIMTPIWWVLIEAGSVLSACQTSSHLIPTQAWGGDCQACLTEDTNQRLRNLDRLQIWIHMPHTQTHTSCDYIMSSILLSFLFLNIIWQAFYDVMCTHFLEVVWRILLLFKVNFQQISLEALFSIDYQDSQPTACPIFMKFMGRLRNQENIKPSARVAAKIRA